MKSLNNEEIIYLLEHCKIENCRENRCVQICPLWKECLHYFTGEKFYSCLEETTYSEIIEELFALIKGIADSGAMLDEEVDTFERLTNEYYILKSMEKSE